MSSMRDGDLSFGLTSFKEVLKEIDKALDERYVFPNEECPWKQKYWTENNDVASTCIYEDGIVPHRTDMYRTMWLVNEAHSMLVERRYMLAMRYSTHPPVTTKSVMRGAILAGTCDAQLNNDRMKLRRQRGL